MGRLLAASTITCLALAACATAPAADAPSAQAQAPAPQIRDGGATVSGTLPREFIQRIVRKNYQTIRKCYLDGLARDSKLTGTVTTQFTIEKDGSVSSARDGGSTLPDAQVISCVVMVFKGLLFPESDAKVVVSYPLDFTPD